MKVLTYFDDGRLRLGIRAPQGVVDVASLPGIPPQTMAELLALGEDALQELAGKALAVGGRPEAGLRLGPCMPDPEKIVCIGRNYRGHAAETGNPVPETPILFSKFSNSLAAAGEAIPLPANAVQFDYEAELAVIIGRQARDVPEGHALDYVFGYCNANDISARDLQFRTTQWLLGKSLDHSMPIGPYLVTKDEVPDPQSLQIRCWVNGELRQHANTAEMLFGVAELLSYISRYMTLEPGDIISTGTPEGVVFGMEEKVWLKARDEVVVEVENLGRLSNRMA